MAEILVKYKKDPRARKPLYTTAGAAGADLFALLERDIALKPGSSVLIPTGVYLEIPPGYEAQIRPRSGLAVKFGITIINAPGTIDSDYRGEIKVGLVNLGKQEFVIHDGDRIAQLVFSPVVKASFVSVETISPSERGEGGFGSTGINE